MRNLPRTAFTLAGLALAAGTALTAVSPAGAATTAPMQLPSPFSEGFIVNANSGKCLVPLRDNLFSNGDVVVQATCNDTVAQAWELIPIGTQTYWDFKGNLPSYRIVNAASGLCLDDMDGVSSDGATVQEWACNTTSTTMQWGDLNLPNGNDEIDNLRASHNRNAPIGLEVPTGSVADDVPVLLYTGWDPQPAAQQWEYQRIA